MSMAETYKVHCCSVNVYIMRFDMTFDDMLRDGSCFTLLLFHFHFHRQCLSIEANF